MAETVTLKLDGVSKIFAKVEKEGVTHAVEHVDLELRSGEFVSLVGASGCGKSTILRHITGVYQQDSGLVLVAGLGNRAITPDAVGPKVHQNTLVTRHLVRQMPEHFGSLRPVASVAAEVMGTTGVESGELVRAVCEKLQPACVVAVDALASRSLKRLCKTVQIADTGITPGSGVGNHRMGLTRDTLGVPVIAVGVPTVVDGATLAADLLGTEQLPDLGEGGGLLVTPKDIDSQVNDLAKVIGYGVSMALQPGISLEELELLLS